MASEQTVLEVMVLSLLGWVDGRFDESEHEASRKLLEGTMEGKELHDELLRMGTTLPIKADVVAAVQAAPREVSQKALLAGFTLARADGYLHENELAILLELSLAAGVPPADVERIGALGIHQAFIELERLFPR